MKTVKAIFTASAFAGAVATGTILVSTIKLTSTVGPQQQSSLTIPGVLQNSSESQQQNATNTASPLEGAGPLQNLGPLQAAGPLQSSGPLQAAGPLQSAGPLSGATPVNYVGPIPTAMSIPSTGTQLPYTAVNITEGPGLPSSAPTVLSYSVPSIAAQPTVSTPTTSTVEIISVPPFYSPGPLPPVIYSPTQTVSPN